MPLMVRVFDAKEKKVLDRYTIDANEIIASDPGRYSIEGAEGARPDEVEAEPPTTKLGKGKQKPAE